MKDIIMKNILLLIVVSFLLIGCTVNSSKRCPCGLNCPCDSGQKCTCGAYCSCNRGISCPGK